jgi:protein SCO1/2
MNRWGVPLVFASILSGVAFGVVIALWQPPPQARGMEVIPVSADQNRVAVSSLEDVAVVPVIDEKSWQLVVLGYLHCPDVCPTSLSELRALKDRPALIGQPLKVLFISVDPDRDRPFEVNEFASRFGADFNGTTADHERLQQLTNELGLSYRIPEQRDEFYLVNHSSVISLVDPEYRLRGRLRLGFDQQRSARQILRLINP